MKYTVIGGRLLGPVDLTIEGQLPVSIEKYEDNMRRAAVCGVPEVEKYSLGGRKVALVGGGPSINMNVDTLKAWDGPIWAVNGAYRWCMERGIDATLFAIDPDRIVLKWAEGAHRAMIGNTCDPEVFDLLKGTDLRQVRIAADGIKGTSSTATTVPHLAAYMGAGGATFFGCESSFEGDSHAYQERLDVLIKAGLHVDRDDHMIIDCGGADYLTNPDLFRQAGELATYINGLPDFLTEESGGLLRAMVQNPEHHIKWMSESFARTMSLIRPAAQAT